MDQRTRDLTPADRDVAQHIRYARLLRRRTQLECAEALGISQGQFSNYERAYSPITAGMLAKLSEYLNYPVHRFYEDV